MNQTQLGYTIETLGDHPNKPDPAEVYNRNPGWPYPTNQTWLEITTETLANHPNKPEVKN